ncbi:hypothetical protein A0H81_11409 [Grifola frondosa]|uniref:Uncharacterized protein n=1 Tax=Grifola frondosa TaxID=5627 RepID=A0A1C7LW18_GRIFR|nr:hypothetical protein A0H81_11409 [Grifola frondosa]
MATLATSTDTEPQARALRDLRWTTFVDFCSESLHAATSENPSSNDSEERRNRIQYMLSYLRRYIETEGYKYCDESGFLRNMECLCREILLAAQVFPESIEVPDELAAMLWKAIKAKLTKVEDYDQDFVTRYNEGTVWDDLSAIEALATTSAQPQASGSKGKGAQVNSTGNSRSSTLHEEADVQSESHGEPSNSLVTSSEQLDQGAEGQFGVVASAPSCRSWKEGTIFRIGMAGPTLGIAVEGVYYDTGLHLARKEYKVDGFIY